MLHLVLVALFAAADPPAFPPLTVSEYEIAYLGDDRLCDEIQITAHQRASLRPFVFSAFNESLRHRSDKTDARQKVLDKNEKQLAAILWPKQQPRLRQVILQHLARVPAGPVTIAADAGLVAKLGLSDEQVKRLRGRETLTAVLTPEQAKTWATLTGPAYPHRLTLRGVGFSPVGMPPPEMTALNTYVVITELKLSDAQLDKLDELFWKWADLFPDLSPPSVNIDRERDEFGKLATALLTADQRTRLAEILFQHGVLRRGRVSEFEHPAVAAAVSLTAEQKAKLAAARGDRRKELVALFLTGDPVETIKTRVTDHQEKTPDVLAALVTAEQREKFAALRGKPLPRAFLNRIGEGIRPYELPPPSRTMFFADHLAAFAALPFAHQAIKADAEQGKKLTALAAEFNLVTAKLLTPEGTDDERRKRAGEVDKRLTNILKPEQAARLWQLTLLNYPLMGSLHLTPTGPLRALDFFTDTLKLTPSQVCHFDRGARLDEVLTADQRKAWAAVVGEPPPPAAPPPQVLGLMQAYPYLSLSQTSLAVVRDQYVQKHLKLTPEQQKAVAAVKVPTARDLPPLVATGGYQDWAAKVDAMGQPALKDALAALDDTQKARVRQIALQQCSRAPYPGVLPLYGFPEVAADLKLTAEQTKSLAGLVGEYQALFTMLFHLPDASTREGDDRSDGAIALAKVYEAKCQGVLTADQKAAWKGLFGEPYKGVILIR